MPRLDLHDDATEGVTFIKLLGVSPEDFDGYEESYRFASAVHDLAREEFDLSVEDVQTVMDEKHHEIVSRADLNAEYALEWRRLGAHISALKERDEGVE